MASLTDEEIDRCIEASAVARLATVDGDGNPHVVPIVFAIHAGRLWSPVDGKAKRSTRLARLANVAVHPRVSVLIDRYDDDWRSLWWVRIDGDARVVTDADLAGEEFSAVEAALREKYPQYRDVPLFSGVPTLLCIAPRARRIWRASDASPLRV